MPRRTPKCTYCKFYGCNTEISRGNLTADDNTHIDTGRTYGRKPITAALCGNEKTSREDVQTHKRCKKVMQAFRVLMLKAGIDEADVVPTCSINTCANFEKK